MCNHANNCVRSRQAKFRLICLLIQEKVLQPDATFDLTPNEIPNSRFVEALLELRRTLDAYVESSCPA